MSSTAMNATGINDIELEEQSSTLIDIHSPSTHLAPNTERGNIRIDSIRPY